MLKFSCFQNFVLVVLIFGFAKIKVWQDLKEKESVNIKMKNK